MRRRTAAVRASRLARAIAATLVLALNVGLSTPGAADEAEVPASVQAQLLSKVPAYDRGFRQRAGSLVSVLILTDPSSPESVRAGTLMQAALLNERVIAGLPQRSFVHPLGDVTALVAEVKTRSVSIVYVTPGLLDQLDTICKALEPLNVLTITASPEYVQRCVIVGFQAIGGKPKILIHLEHAQRSGVRFRSELLELAKVYR